MQKRAIRNRALEAISVTQKIPAQIMRPAVLAFSGNHFLWMKLFSTRPAGSKPTLSQSIRALLAFTIRRKSQHPTTCIKRPETPVPKLLPVVRVFQQPPCVNFRTSENGSRFMRCQKLALHCLPCNEAPRLPASTHNALRFPFQRRFELLPPKPFPVRTRVDPATDKGLSYQSSG